MVLLEWKYHEPDQATDVQIKELDIKQTLTRLTIDEKIRLLSGVDLWHTFAVERLNIPSLRMSDGPNGIRGTKVFNGVPAACFPCGTGLAATFNKQLLVDAGKLMGVEAKHKGAHIILGPTTNMQRGPLGGRGFESFSEDPYLAGHASVSIINGIQSEGIAATIKHFVCNDLEDERRSSDSIVTDRALREIYLEPFRIAIKYSHPVCVMTSYNKLNGTHCSQNKHTLTDILHEEWGWKGTTMSDWRGTYTSKDSLINGLDIEMPGPTYYRSVNAIKQMVESKELNIKVLNERVANVLNLIKYCSKSGIAEHAPEDTKNNTPETSNLLKDIARESIVLLKNDDTILPLKTTETIGIIGPNAKYAAYSGGGSANLNPYYTTTPFSGISSKLPSPPPYTVGAHIFKRLPSLATQLINPTTGNIGYHMKFYKKAPKVKGDRELFDEIDSDFYYLNLNDYENAAINSFLYYIDIEGDFTPNETGHYEFGLTVQGSAVLYINNEIVVDNKTKQTRGPSFENNGTIEVRKSIKLKKGETYKLKIEFGTFPTSVLEHTGNAKSGGLYFGCAKRIDDDDEIKNAVKLAKSVDKVILCIGLTSEWESEGFDRKNMKLPFRTNDLVDAVLEANSNTVIVNQSGTPVEFPWIGKAKCLVQAWYGGDEAGNAIADVLFGDYNPSGKLSLTFPFRNSDNPAFLNFKTDRGKVLYGEGIFIGYRYYEKLERDVAFPFGYGLSYTDFEYSNLKLFISEENDRLEASVDVKNIGKIDGSETVQLYISHLDSETIKPVKELKGFEKVFILAKASKHVKFSLSLKDSVSFYDEYLEQWHMESGNYSLLLGKSSSDIELVESFKIKDQKLWSGL